MINHVNYDHFGCKRHNDYYNCPALQRISFLFKFELDKLQVMEVKDIFHLDKTKHGYKNEMDTHDLKWWIICHHSTECQVQGSEIIL